MFILLIEKRSTRFKHTTALEQSCSKNFEINQLKSCVTLKSADHCNVLRAQCDRLKVSHRIAEQILIPILRLLCFSNSTSTSLSELCSESLKIEKDWLIWWWRRSEKCCIFVKSWNLRYVFKIIAINKKFWKVSDQIWMLRMTEQEKLFLFSFPWNFIRAPFLAIERSSQYNSSYFIFLTVV